MSILSKLIQAAGAAALIAATPMAQTSNVNLTVFTQVQAQTIDFGIEVTGPRNSPVLLAASFQAPLKHPIQTPYGGLRLRGIDGIIMLHTDSTGRARLQTSLARPAQAFYASLQALAGGQLSNPVLLGAGNGGSNQRAASFAWSDAGGLDVHAKGGAGEWVELKFYDENGRQVGGTHRVKIDGNKEAKIEGIRPPDGAKTFKVTVERELVAEGPVQD